MKAGEDEWSEDSGAHGGAGGKKGTADRDRGNEAPVTMGIRTQPRGH